MAVQNLVSAVLPPEDKKEILSMFGSIKGKLGFLLSMDVGEVQSIFKAGDGYQPFIDKAYRAASEHPEILSGVFKMAEFKKDYDLSKDLAEVDAQVRELAEGLQKTLMAVNSDALAEALEVYAAIKQNKDKVPGLAALHEDLAAFFKKTRKVQAKAKV